MKDIRTIKKFRGYESNREPTNIEADQFGVLVSPSQNCYVTTEGVVQSREGTVAFGTPAGSSILSAYTWQNNRNTELPLRSTSTKLQVYYDSDWVNIFTVTSGKLDYAEWWDNVQKRDIILFVEGTDTVHDWSGAISKITGVVTDTVTINMDTSTAGFIVGDGVTIDGTNYTIMSFPSSTSIKLSANPGAVTNSYIYTTVVSIDLFSYSIILDPSSPPVNNVGKNLNTELGFVFDTLAVEDNRVFYGCASNRRYFITKNSSYSDMRFSNPRLSGEGDTGVLDAPVTKFMQDASQGRMVASCGPDKMFEMKNKLLATTTATSFTSVKRLRSGYGSGVVNKYAMSEIKYSIVFVTHGKDIDSLGRAERLDTTQAKPLSSKIVLDLDAFDTSDAVTYYYKNSLFVSFPSQSRVYEYSFEQSLWQAPYTMNIGAFCVVNGLLVGHDSSGQSSYLLQGANDNNIAIDVVMAFNYETDGKRFLKKQFDLTAVEGYISTGGLAYAEHLFDFEGFSGSIKHKIQVGAANTIFQGSVTLGGFGRARIGTMPLGSASQPQKNSTMGENMNKFRLIAPNDPVDYYEGQVILSTSQLDTRLIIVSYGANQRISPNNAVHAE